jgi:hypothetical protein
MGSGGMTRGEHHQISQAAIRRLALKPPRRHPLGTDLKVQMFALLHNLGMWAYAPTQSINAMLKELMGSGNVFHSRFYPINATFAEQQLV